MPAGNPAYVDAALFRPFRNGDDRWFRRQFAIVANHRWFGRQFAIVANRWRMAARRLRPLALTRPMSMLI
jgi:hypothetical protein